MSLFNLRKTYSGDIPPRSTSAIYCGASTFRDACYQLVSGFLVTYITLSGVLDSDPASFMAQIAAISLITIICLASVNGLRFALARTCAWSEKQVLLVIPVCVCLEHTTRAREAAHGLLITFVIIFSLFFCWFVLAPQSLDREKFAIYSHRVKTQKKTFRHEARRS